MFGQPGTVCLSLFFVIFVSVTLKSACALDNPHFGFMKALKIFKRSSAVFCTYKGKTYQQGSEWIDYDDCEECHCQAGDNVRCIPVKCEVPMCVDFYIPEGKCCEVCPGSSNCKLGDGIIIAGQTAVENIGNCKNLCNCPGKSTYARDREDTRANCKMVCQQQ